MAAAPTHVASLPYLGDDGPIVQAPSVDDGSLLVVGPHAIQHDQSESDDVQAPLVDKSQVPVTHRPLRRSARNRKPNRMYGLMCLTSPRFRQF